MSLRGAIATKFGRGTRPDLLKPRESMGLAAAQVSPSKLIRIRVTRDLTRPVSPPQIERDIAGRMRMSGPTIKDADVIVPAPDTYDCTDAVGLTALVSDNLLTAIGRPDPRGKNYAARDKQAALFGDGDDHKKRGGRQRQKAYRERKTGTAVIRKIVSLWDMILPLLKPPIDFDFPSQLDFPSELYPFQVEAVRRLVANQSFLLGDDMGTGKTVMATVALRILFHKGLVRHALVVAPPNVTTVWEEHLRDWAGPVLSCTIVYGSPRAQRRQDWRCPAHVYVTSYDTLRNDIAGTEPTLRSMDLSKFDIAILDEVHHIRNASSGKARAARKLVPTYRWGLSGTPLQNRLEDLAAVFRFVKPDLPLSTAQSTARVRDLIAPCFLRRRKKDVLQDLPEKVSQDLWVQLDSEQRRAYEELLATGREQFADGSTPLTRLHIFALLQKLKQICNFAPRATTSPKMELLLDQLDEIVEENKAVVFTQYLGEGVDKLRVFLQKYGLVEITGKTPGAQRARFIASFQTDPDKRLFLGTTRTAGEGITLTEGSYVFHFDHWWNPATARQAEDRVHRKGQKRQVNVYHYWAEDTVEERIYEILERKGLLYEEVIDAMAEEDINNAISMEDWCDVLGLDVKVAKEVVETGEVPPTGRSLAAVYRSLSQLSPHAFELAASRVFQHLGFSNARVTGRAHDGGIDIEASRTVVGGPERIVVQCKKKPQVGVHVARELLGVVTADPRISKGFLVVSGKVSQPCRKFIREHGNLSCIEGVELAKRIIEFDIALAPQ